MKTERQLTGSALCAKAIRTELKLLFPNIKFRVTSYNFAGGNSVTISYADSVKVETIEAVTDKYQYGTFDGMDDCYNHTNVIEGLPQAKYVDVNRHQSDEVYNSIIQKLEKEIDGFDVDNWIEDRQCYGSTLVYREFRKNDY